MSRARHARPAAPAVMVKATSSGEPPVAIPGKAVMQESKEGSKGFKKGGAATGDCAPGRMDKPVRKARGGAATMRGRSPMSAAASTSMPSGKTSH